MDSTPVLHERFVHSINRCSLSRELTSKRLACEATTKEDIGIDLEQQLYEIVRGKNFALNYLSWKFTEMIMITIEVIPENLVVVR